MTELLTAAQMRAIETAAIESGAVTGLELMERAGAGVVEAVFEEWPELGQGPHRAVVLCGPGNNGGDGFVVARLLKERGWEVEVFLYGNAERLPPDAKANFERWAEMGEVRDILRSGAATTVQLGPEETGVLVDALFGTGLTRALDISLRLCLGDFLSRVPICFLKSIAIDVPSGFCADSGKWLRGEDGHSAKWKMDLVVTFHRPRVGHYLSSNYARCLKVKSIGLDEIEAARRERKLSQSLKQLSGLFDELGNDLDEQKNEGQVAINEREGTGIGFPLVELISAYDSMVDKAETLGTHKFSHGHALILSGGAGKTGAARLAARGALRIGVGLVTLGVPPSAQMEVATQITALMLTRVADADGLAEVLKDARINALCLGPGLGVERARDLVPVALGNGGQIAHPTRVVLDADALTAFQDNPQTLFDMLHENCVLTPHGGEFARLFPDIAEKLNAPATKGPAYSKVDATREAAKRAGCVVLFKGPDTVIADPSGRCSINAAVYDREAPWLATAGSGDVLAGFITGLLARGFTPMQAAETAAWLHVECARGFGPGLIAEDLPEELPKVFRELNL